ncbi:MAG: alternative ribosome rescue aminoacyl-tRNA hydrolase ArfB [Planctomycetota bacterium]|nr:alternative ribosome rescue aminoacyl-tRNA hydrolase ArfB [Planctomycetota bacterium]
MESPDGSKGLPWRTDRWIPWSEIEITQQTRGGPGGQHANRSATAIDLRWSPVNSGAFEKAEQQRLIRALSSRIDSDGRIRIVASDERSATRNRQLALKRLSALVSDALKPRIARRATKPTRSSREKRIQQKKNRSQLKKDRRKPATDDN